MRMEEFIYPLRIYFDDTDALGTVYHANYLKFMERARSEWMEQVGYGLAWQRKHNIGFVIHSVQMQFLRPGRLHDQVEVISKIANLRRASMVYEQHLRLKDQPDKILCTADVKIACIDNKMRPCPLPEFKTLIGRLQSEL